MTEQVAQVRARVVRCSQRSRGGRVLQAVRKGSCGGNLLLEEVALMKGWMAGFSRHSGGDQLLQVVGEGLWGGNRGAGETVIVCTPTASTAAGSPISTPVRRVPFIRAGSSRLP